MLNVGFIGCGNMGSALSTAVTNSKIEYKLYLADANNTVANELSCKTGGTVSTNKKIAEECDYIFLAVKPNIVLDVVNEIAPFLKEGAVIVSMAAGVPAERIAQIVQDHSVIRIMPNTPAAVGSGVILYTADKAKRAEIEVFLNLMVSAGSLNLIKEELIDSATAISGCSPAYTYMFIEAIASAGAEIGIAPDMALKLAAETVKGAADMVLKNDIPPKTLCENVCSPSGSTIEGVKSLNNDNFAKTVQDCIKAAYNRTKELAN